MQDVVLSLSSNGETMTDVTDTGEIEAFEESTKPLGPPNEEDILRRDIRNLGLEFESMATLCRESACSLDGVHGDERLFAVSRLERGLSHTEDSIRNRRLFYSEVMEALRRR